MSPSYLVGRFDIEQQESLLVALINHFHAVDLPYQIEHKDCTTHVFVYHPSHREEAIAFMSQYEAAQLATNVHRRSFWPIVLDRVKSDPVCILCLFFFVLCFCMFLANNWAFLSSLTFQDVQSGKLSGAVSGFDTIINIVYDGQFWRLMTPAFLYFEWPAFLFGVVTFTYLGWQIERREGTLFFIFALTFLSVIVNVCQFYLSPNAVFGGSVGVTLGLVTYAVLSNFYYEEPVYLFSPWFVLFALSAFIWDMLDNDYRFLHYMAYLAPLFFGSVLVFFRQHVLYHFYGLKIKNW